MISFNMAFFKTIQGKPLSILTHIYERTKVYEVQINDENPKANIVKVD